jgi:hypothetical protein
MSDMVLRIIILGFLMCVSVCFISCNSKEEPLIKKEYYDNGTLRAEYFFLDDTIADGKYRTYYRSGNIESEGSYKNYKKDGVQTVYYENGNVSSVGNFVEGIRTDSAKWFYQNGKLMMHVRFHNDTIYGEGYEYYKNGTLDRYIFRDFGGQILFEIKYDSGGRLVTRQGDALVNFDLNRERFEVGDTLKLSILVAPHRGAVREWKSFQISPCQQ